MWQSRTVTEPTPGMAAEPHGDAFTAALVAELAKKTGVCWLRYDVPAETYDAQGRPVHDAPGRDAHLEQPPTRAAWHVWLDDALYLVSGGDEQHLPGIEHVDRVEVVMRSKESGGRLVTWVGRASAVRPDDELWEPATAALVSERLNLDDLATAAAEWAERSVVTRIVPTGEVLEEPGRLSDESHAAPPPATGATTRGLLPKVLHRRVRRRPRLS